MVLSTSFLSFDTIYPPPPPHFPLLTLFATIRHYSRLFATIRDCSPLFVTVRHYSRLFATIRECSPLFATVRHYSRPFATIRDYPLFVIHVFQLPLCILESVKCYLFCYSFTTYVTAELRSLGRGTH